MKKSLGTILAAGALVLGATPQAEAVQINGSLGFTGVFTANVGNPLSNATSINIVSAAAEDIHGDFTGFVSDGDPVAVSSPLTLVAGLGVTPVTFPANPFYSVGGFQLDIGTLDKVSAGNTFVTLYGTGTMSGNGYTPTPGEITLSFTRAGLSFTYAATSSGDPVPTPDGGATVMLLGLGLVGAAAVRRQIG